MDHDEPPPTADHPDRAAGPDDPDAARSPAGSDASDAHTPLHVEVLLDTTHPHDTDPPAADWLGPMLRLAADHAGVRTGELALLLVGDDAMAAYHEQYCGVAGTTDVITFDHLDRPAGLTDPPATHVEGDLVLCVDEAQRQALTRGHDARTELLLYAVHGLLHLLGEDDHDPAAYARMHQREDDLLRALGLGPVFHPPTP